MTDNWLYWLSLLAIVLHSLKAVLQGEDRSCVTFSEGMGPADIAYLKITPTSNVDIQRRFSVHTIVSSLTYSYQRESTPSPPRYRVDCALFLSLSSSSFSGNKALIKTTYCTVILFFHHILRLAYIT